MKTTTPDGATPTLPTAPSLSVPEAAKLLGIGKTLAYELAQTGELPGVYQVGSRYRCATAKVLEHMGLQAA